jgi:hypothetical protein
MIKKRRLYNQPTESVDTQQNNNPTASQTEEDEPALYQLSAEVLDKNDRNYECVRRLNEQIHKADVRNIALTGAYGAGKTTILETLINKFTDNEYIRLSLANFNITGEDDDEKNFIKSKKEEKLNRLLEYSIIQQLIYHEDHKTLPESRFKRIKAISPKRVKYIARSVLIFFCCLFVIFPPSFFQSTSIYNFLTVPHTVKLIIDFACGIVVLLMLFKFVLGVIRTWQSSQLSKITIKGMEVGFINKETHSILNKHIDEILYFFESTKYNVVIIEDLDRFKTPLIFAKLKEINALVNSYKPIRDSKRKVAFVYAIKDDLFIDKTLRTKFFDVIVPVIPIVDPSNAGSKLKNLLSVKVPSDALQIDDSVFKDLGRFVAEMRLLKTIVNDYLIYRKILSGKLHPANLLAMMAYKNFYPQDFIALSHQKGLLFSVLDNKQVFTKKLRDKIDEQIKQLKQQITEIEAQKVSSLKELKDLYIYRILYHHNNLTHFVDTDGKAKALSDVYNDEDLFRRLAFGEIDQYKYPQYGTYYSQKFTKTFSSIQAEVDPKHTYAERVELWNRRENGEISRLNQRIQQLEGEKLELPYRPIAEFFVEEIKPDINDFVHSNKKGKKGKKGGSEERLLLYVLQSGLIDSNYYDYISFFHEGLLSSSDNEFLMNITSKRNTPFAHPLHKHGALIEEIPLPTFKCSYILNFSLLNFLCNNSQKYVSQLAYIFEQLKNADDNKIAFVKEFVTTNDAAGKFLKLFSKNWNGLWPFIEDNLAEDAETFAYLFVKHLSVEEMKGINTGQRFKLFLDRNFELFGVWETQIDPKTLIEVIDKLDIIFNSIDSTRVSKELFQKIDAGAHYAITNDNIKAILKFHDKIDLLEKIDRAHYSSVLESGIKSLNDYINLHLEHYTDKVLILTETSKEENEDALIKIINSDSILDAPKKKYLLNQSGWINGLEAVDPNHQNLAFESRIIFPTWANVMKYYGKRFADNNPEPLSDSLFAYFTYETVYSKLTNDKIYTQSDNTKAITALFAEISSELNLKDVCYISLLKSFDKEELPANMDLSSYSQAKINFLIYSGLMPYSDHYLGQLKGRFEGLVPTYLTIHKDEYLENAGNVSLDSTQYFTLLSSEAFSPDEKITIAENISSSELDEDSELATLICQVITKGSFKLDEDFLKEIVGLCEDNPLKAAVVFKYLTSVDYDEDVVSEYLNLLSEDYQKIAIRGKKPRISIESNMVLLDYLKTNGYLKNVIPHDNHITVVTRD